MYLNEADTRVSPKPEMHWSIAGGSIAHAGGHVVELNAALRNNLNAGADAIAIALHTPKCNIKPMTRMRATVHPYLRLLPECRCYYVHAPVSVKIAKGTATVTGRSSRQSCLSSKRFPFSTGAKVTKHRIGLVNFCPRKWLRFYMSARHEQVFPSIIVKIVQAGAIPGHGCAQHTHSRCIGHFLEVSLSGVLKDWEGLVIQSDKDDVWPTIVIVVAKVEAHSRNECPIFSQRHPSLKGNFLEFASQVMKEKIIFGIIGHKKIRTAIVIIICHTNAHPFAYVVADAPFF